MKLTRSLLALTVMLMVSACGAKAPQTVVLPEPVSMDVNIYMLTTKNANGLGDSVGVITITETANGLVFFPMLKGLPAGVHGFHLHENANLAPKKIKRKLVAGLQAGGHYDPKKTGKHLGPYNEKGHFGDLPALYVNKDGITAFGVLAPRIKTLDEIRGRSIMIHFGGDNYADRPKILGGGGGRMAGGIIEEEVMIEIVTEVVSD